MSNVIQIVRFRVKEGVEAAAFQAVNERFQREVAPTLPGLLRREATVAEDGEWLLVLRYDSMENARGGAQRDVSALAQQFMSMIDMATMSASFYTLVSE